MGATLPRGASPHAVGSGGASPLPAGASSRALFRFFWGRVVILRFGAQARWCRSCSARHRSSSCASTASTGASPRGRLPARGPPESAPRSRRRQSCARPRRLFGHTRGHVAGRRRACSRKSTAARWRPRAQPGRRCTPRPPPPSPPQRGAARTRRRSAARWHVKQHKTKMPGCPRPHHVPPRPCALSRPRASFRRYSLQRAGGCLRARARVLTSPLCAARAYRQAGMLAATLTRALHGPSEPKKPSCSLQRALLIFR